MKRFTKSTFVFFLFVVCVTSGIAQRRQWVHSPFNWKMLEDTSQHTRIIFTEQMEDVAREAMTDLDSIVSLYSVRLFADSFMATTTDAYRHTFVPLDSLKQPTWKTGPWRSTADPVTVVLYPNEQRFNEQMIIPTIFPPEILGFTEYLSSRIAVPYRGNQHDFRDVLAHETVHAMERLYIRAQAKTRQYGDLHNSDSPRMPLWATEGFAEYGATDMYLKSRGESEDYRMARTRYRNILFVANDKLPSLEELNTFGDFGVYTLGHEFHMFMASRFGSDRFIRVRRKCAETMKFEDAWNSVFGETLQNSWREWWKYMKRQYYAATFFQGGDSLVRSVLTDKTNKGISEVNPIGAVGYDFESQRMIYYEQNPKWGLIVKTYGFADTTDHVESIDHIEIDHQFNDQSLWYRAMSASAIRGSRVAVVIPNLQRDLIRIYRFAGNHVSLEREMNIDGLLAIKSLSFAGNDSLIFVGVDSSGQQDVYMEDLSRKITHRLTNSRSAKGHPGFIGTTLCYIESGGLRDEHRLVLADDYGTRRAMFDSSGFVDDWIYKDSMIVVRSLGSGGIPDIYLWKLGSPTAFRYRYGESIVAGYGDFWNVRYPLVSQLVGFATNGSFIVHESESESFSGGRFVRILPDSRLLSSTAVIMENESQDFSLRRKNMTLSMQPPDPTYRYKGYLLPNGPFGYSFLELPNTDATGEHGLSMMMFVRFGYAYNIYAGVREFDFSSRPLVQNAIGLSVQPKLYVSDRTATGVDFLKEGILKAERIWTWPLSLNNGVSALAGIGMLAQEPLDSLLRDSTRLFRSMNYTQETDSVRFSRHSVLLTSPFIRFGTEFVSDGTFIDLARSTRHGYYIGFSCVGMYSVAGPLAWRLINMTISAEAIHYWRPWNSRWYVASRVGYYISPGESPYAFFDPDLHRQPGFFNIAPSRSYGNSMLRYAVEARFPLTRMFLMDYEFWEHNTPWWFFPVSAVPFVYGGDITYLGTPFRMEHRYGLAMKIGLSLWFPFNIRFEEYRTSKGDRWYSGWTFEVEY